MARLSDDMHVYIHRDDTLKDILFDITARLERIEAEVGIGPAEGIEKIDVGEYMRDMNKRLGECEQALLPPNLRCPEDKKPKSTCVDCGKKPLSRACDRWYLAGYGPMCLTCFHERLPG